MVAITHKSSIDTPTDFLWTAEEYERLAIDGYFDGQRVELIEGRIIQMPPMGWPHQKATSKAHKACLRLFGLGDLGFNVFEPSPINASKNSMPEPDVWVAPGNLNEMQNRPQTCVLVIEVSDTTLSFDRNVKMRVYAQAQIQDYWIVNLVDQVAEVFRNPHQDTDGMWTYDSPIIIRPGESIEPLAKPGSVIPVNDLLP